jgi:hypothetical protein
MGTDSQFAALLVLGRHPSNLHSAAEPTRAATPQTINRNPATERSLSGSSAADETATRHSQSGKWTSTTLLLGACDQNMGGRGRKCDGLLQDERMAASWSEIDGRRVAKGAINLAVERAQCTLASTQGGAVDPCLAARHRRRQGAVWGAQLLWRRLAALSPPSTSTECACGWSRSCTEWARRRRSRLSGVRPVPPAPAVMGGPSAPRDPTAEIRRLVFVLRDGWPGHTPAPACAVPWRAALCPARHSPGRTCSGPTSQSDPTPSCRRRRPPPLTHTASRTTSPSVRTRNWTVMVTFSKSLPQSSRLSALGRGRGGHRRLLP